MEGKKMSNDYVRCLNCGAEILRDELEYTREYMGEFWGMPAYEDAYVCPHCGSDDIEDSEVDDDEEC